MTEWLRGDLVIAGGALASALLVMNGAVAFWTITRLRELRQVRERMSRLADGLALLTDTTEAGLATVIREVEHLTRQALSDVRATVSGYREVSLSAEVVGARAALRAAGVEADLPSAVDNVRRPQRRELAASSPQDLAAQLAKPLGAKTAQKEV